MAYVGDQTVSFPFELPVCLVLFFIFLVFIFILNVSNAIIVTRISKSTKSLRALYIFIFYPILLLSYLIACYEEFFQTALIFGFPIFIAGMILLPYGALVINTEARITLFQNLVINYCQNCYYPIQMHRDDQERRCVMCGTMTKNIYYRKRKQISTPKK
ncbi:MAG: hypothetical protein KAJ51_13535 [Thermoplasmata archaeon]|nr:hypothetical protein [Thermoplasmata archaeon]